MHYTQTYLFNQIENWKHKLLSLSDMYSSKEQAIQRVRELHKPTQSFKGANNIKVIGCLECEETGSGREYFVEYPCPTIKALDGVQ